MGSLLSVFVALVSREQGYRALERLKMTSVQIIFKRIQKLIRFNETQLDFIYIVSKIEISTNVLRLSASNLLPEEMHTKGHTYEMHY